MIKDTILSKIFPEQAPGASIASAEVIDQSNQAIIEAVKGLHVPRTNARQKAAIAGNGRLDLGEKSQAYCDLLARRPGLGRKCGLTAERYQVVISKDRRYDAMTSNIRIARSVVRTGLATVEARLTEDAGAVLVYANDLILETRSPRLRAYFLPIGDTLDDLDRQAADHKRRQQRKQEP